MACTLPSVVASAASSSENLPSSVAAKPTSFALPLAPPASPHQILHPSLQFANLLWFKGSYNAQVFVGDNEPTESVVKRFRRAVMQAGVISECRRRRFFETPQDILKRKRQALQRKRPKRFFPRPEAGPKEALAKGKGIPDDNDDNWEYDMD